MKTFDQRCTICFENFSVRAFAQCRHQCVSENCYASCFKAADGTQSVHKNSNVEMLMCAVCRN